MFQRKSNWLLDDNELHPTDRPGSADWFALTDEVGRGRANQRSDVIKIESLLGRAGLFDVERLDGPLGYANEQLDKPIRDFQRKNGLAVDGYLRPDGPTIGKFKELYGGEYAPFPVPSPSMIDAHHAQRDQGEDGFLVDRWPTLEVRPHPRLDPLRKDFGFDDWNEDWVRFQAGQRGGFDGMPEELLKNIAQNDVRGIVQARDVAQRWATHRPEDGSAFARRMVQALEGKPILQSAFLAGPVPQSPPLGVPTPTGLADYGNFVRDARAAEGIAEPAQQNETPARPANDDDARNEDDDDTPPVQVADAKPATQKPAKSSNEAPKPPRAPISIYDEAIGARDTRPVPDLESLGRTAQKPTEDDKKRHAVFVRASRQLPGAGSRELEVLRHIYATEGGDWFNETGTKASSGMIESAFDDVKKRGNVPAIKNITLPGDVPTDRRPEVLRDYLNESLKKAGGGAALERFEHQTVANAVASTVFYQGATGGGTAVRQALKETVKDNPSPGMSKILSKGTITAELLDELTPVLKDPTKRDAFLENLADARIPILENAVGKKPGELTDAETRAINDYRPNRAKR